MNFYETYKEDIQAFFEALIDFIKTIIAKLTAGEEAEGEAAEG